MIKIGEEPELPPLPDIGDVLDRKKRFKERVKTVIKCDKCKEETIKPFTPGEYTFMKLSGEKCIKCDKKDTLTIVEIFSEWYDPKKEK